MATDHVNGWRQTRNATPAHHRLQLASKPEQIGAHTQHRHLDEGRLYAVEIMSICAAVASLVAILLCLRFSLLKRWRRKKRTRASKRPPRTEDYEDAISTNTPFLKPQTTRAPRLYDYEDALPTGTDTNTETLPLRERQPRLDYEVATLVPEPVPFTVHRIDSSGYTIVVPVNELDGESPATPGVASQDYNHLGVENMTRALSLPCKAYSHVAVAPRTMSARAKTNGGGRNEGGVDNVIRYDVSNVTILDAPRVEVIDGIYDKPNKAKEKEEGNEEK
ncbi:uncharacterized protein LOC143290517 [Babylonia areolata]|uniref:uncharacterized protein LOC143290517 n=1 Tax=Babylonia areolata TaxID=304850 RepID=UPI003FD65F44